jgi:hypothetical protein
VAQVHLLAALSIVCGSWFQPSTGWYQPARAGTTLDRANGAQVESWAANFLVSQRYGISRGFPANGIYISVNLVRPPAYGSVWLRRLHFPLLLSNATKKPLFTPPTFRRPTLTLYRFKGRLHHQYNVDVQVIIARDTARVRAKAERELRRLILPRWLPTPSRC